MNTRSAPLLLLLLAALTLAACGAPTTPAAEAPPPASPTPRPTWHPKPTKTPRPAAATTTAEPGEPIATPAPAATPAREATAAPAPTSAPQPEATTFAGVAIVRNGGNVREAPVSGRPLDQVNANETVQLIGKNESGSWYLLETLRHARGWVSATLLRVDPTVAGGVPVVAATTLGSAAPGGADGWATHTIGEAQFQAPAEWTEFPIKDPAALKSLVNKFAALNPEVGKMLQRFTDSAAISLLEFLAINTNPGSQGENVALVVLPRPAGTISDAILEQVVNSLPSSLPGLKVISSDAKRQVNGLQAARVVADMTVNVGEAQPRSFRLVQWYIISANNVYGLTTTGLASDKLIGLGDRIAQTFVTHESASAPATGAPASSEAMEVTNGGNIRREPLVAASNVLGQVCPGDQVAVLERASGGRWVRVRVTVAAPACDPARVPSGAEGWVNASLLGPIAQDARAALPPSLPIARLVPFTHAKTGVSGLRPENWTIFETGGTFQISSSPEAPDGFVGRVMTPEESRSILAMIGRNSAEGPAPEIRENTIAPDGTGTMLATITGTAQGSTQPVRFTFYARISKTPRGLLLAMATVPADMFPQEEALVRQMVDSLTADAAPAGTV